MFYAKADLPADTFICERNIDAIEGARAAILHTRHATQGSPTKNENNHPIALGGIIGVHNGVIWNDREVTKTLNLDRTAEVDSEVIFHVIRDRSIDDVGRHIEGSASIAWIEWDDPDAAIVTSPTVHLARLGGSPLAIAYLADGSMVFASTIELLNQALKWSKLEQVASYSPLVGDYIAFTEGSMTDERKVEEIDRYVYYNSGFKTVQAKTQGATKFEPATVETEEADDNWSWVESAVRPWLKAEDNDEVTAFEQGVLNRWWKAEIDDADVIDLLGDFHEMQRFDTRLHGDVSDDEHYLRWLAENGGPTDRAYAAGGVEGIY